MPPFLVPLAHPRNIAGPFGSVDIKMPNPLAEALDSIEAMLDSLRKEGPPDAQLFPKPTECGAKDITSSSWMPLNGNEHNNPKEATNAKRDLLPRLGVSKTIIKSRKPNAAKRSEAPASELRGQKKRKQKITNAHRFSPKKRKAKTKKSHQNGGGSGPLGTNNDLKESEKGGQTSEDKSDQQFLQKLKNMAEQRRRVSSLCRLCKRIQY